MGGKPGEPEARGLTLAEIVGRALEYGVRPVLIAEVLGVDEGVVLGWGNGETVGFEASMVAKLQWLMDAIVVFHRRFDTAAMTRLGSLEYHGLGMEPQNVIQLVQRGSGESLREFLAQVEGGLGQS